MQGCPGFCEAFHADPQHASSSFQGNLFSQGQEQGSRPGTHEKSLGTPTSLTNEQKIAQAMSGGPAQIAKDANHRGDG